MDIYDIELNTQNELKLHWRSQKVSSTRLYTQQIPVKVLREVGLRVTKYSPSAVHRGSTLVLVLVENSGRVLHVLRR